MIGDGAENIFFVIFGRSMINLKKNNTATELNLVWASDDNYAFLTGVSMTSALINSEDFEEINVWILDNHISDIEKQRLVQCATEFGRNITFINTDECLKKIESLKAMSWGEAQSYSTYSRLFIADLLKPYDVKRVIYIDCDIVVDGSIREVVEWDMKEKAVALVMDYNRVEIRELLNMKAEERYYNAGFLLIDIEQWKERRCTERIIEHMTNVAAIYPYVDQDLINCVLKNDISFLPLKYNVNPRVMQYSYKNLNRIYGINEKNYYSIDEYNQVKKNNPVGYHCADPTAGRPWEENNRHIYSSVWSKYLKLSLWKDCCKKRVFKPIMRVKMQYFLECILPKSLYAYLYGFTVA